MEVRQPAAGLSSVTTSLPVLAFFWSISLKLIEGLSLHPFLSPLSCGSCLGHGISSDSFRSIHLILNAHFSLAALTIFSDSFESNVVLLGRLLIAG
jgi:hypothetical protein